jgi:4-hydroxy-3-methylbut-2-enyl diphosphate reductase
VHVGAVFCADAVVTGAARRRLATSGALAVDTESLVLAAGAAGRPFAAVRAVVDTPSEPLLSPMTVSRGWAALRALRAAGPAIDEWIAALGARDVVLASAAAEALPALAAVTDLVLVVAPASSAPASSDAAHLLGVAGRAGVPAHRVEDPRSIDLRWLAGISRVGIAAGASARPHQVDDLVRALSGLGPVTVRRAHTTGHDIGGDLVAAPQEVS